MMSSSPDHPHDHQVGLLLPDDEGYEQQEVLPAIEDAKETFVTSLLNMDDDDQPFNHIKDQLNLYVNRID